MAIRQVGGVPVYVVEVDVPKVTDSRGKGYGLLVSDLRWKLWEETQNSQLQQMKFEQMSKQAQLDVLEQKQRDISRAIRDARELQSKVKLGGTSASEAARVNLSIAKATQGKTVTRTSPAIDPFTGELIPGETVQVVTRTQPDVLDISPVAAPSAERELASDKARSEAFDRQMDELDQYIADLEAEQSRTGEEFGKFAGGLAGSQDILSRTREAFQSQIGEGGFGIGRRPLRQLPRFDEAQAAGRINETMAREEAALLQEATQRKSQNAAKRIAEFEAAGGLRSDDPEAFAKFESERDNPSLTLDEERKVKDLARERLAQGMTAAGATPTSRAGFLMKDFPPGSALLPREETRFPTGRMRDDFAVASEAETLDRETVVRGELDRVGLGDPAAEGLLMELEDIRRTKRAPLNAPSSIPEAQRRAIELDALGVSAEEAQTRGFMPRDRGFSLPVERMEEGFGQTTTFGTPGGGLDRLNVATRRSPEALSPSPVRSPMESPTPLPGATTSPSVIPEEEISFGGGVVPPIRMEPTPPEIVPDFEEAEDRVKVGGRKPLPGEGAKELYQFYAPITKDSRGKDVLLPLSDKEKKEIHKMWTDESETTSGLSEEEARAWYEGAVQKVQTPRSGKTIPQRRELYAMKIATEGAKLADKPKQFARLAKTTSPDSAPDYVKLVNQIYELNSTKGDKFKLTFDEIAKFYKDEPKVRERAHAYLVAKDMLESGLTKPQA